VTSVAQLPGIDQQDTKSSIQEALNAVMRQVRGVGKKGRNTQQNYNFRGIDDVLNAVGPAFRDHGIVPSPLLEDVTYRDVKTTTGKAAREVTVRVRYRFTGPRGDFQDAVVPGESLDSGDKGVAKAMSVAYRIALIQVLALPTTERDPDTQSWERGTGTPNVAIDADAREESRPSREELLTTVNEVAARVQALRGESDYTALERLANYCKSRLGVNVVTKQSEDGPVEDVDLTKLKDGQLALLIGVMTKSIRELQAATQEV
jgi:hypothetical protein